MDGLIWLRAYGRPASIYDDCLTCNMAGLWGDQEEGGIGDVAGGGRPAHWGDRGPGPFVICIACCSFRHGGAWGDRIYCDLEGR